MARETSRGEELLRVNGRERSVRTGSVARILEQLGYACERPGFAVAVNGRVVPRSAWADHEVRTGDEIEIVGAVQGG